jgi:hypothetical protein
MASRSTAGSRSTEGLTAESFDAPATVVDLAPFRGFRPRPPSTEVELAQFDASSEATRESRDVVELLAAHEMSLARERQALRPPAVPGRPALGLTLEVADGDVEAELPVAVEEFDDAVPTLIRDPTPAFLLSGPFPARVIELPRPPREAPAPPSVPARLRGLPLLVRVALVCGWLVLVGAVGAALSRSWRATSPALPAPAAPGPSSL